MKTVGLLSGLFAGLLSFACQAVAEKGQVLLLPETINMTALERSRQIRLYLPPGYAQSSKRYPVIYMHDAQNLFDAATSYAGEWQVDESLDLLASEGLELIVVGIDHGGEQRISELNPFDHQQYGKAEGKLYLEFIVKQLKPFIDQQYRTLADTEHTAIMGSSMGGLISHYALLQYPDIFGAAGVLSPSYWITGKSFSQFWQTKQLQDHRLFLYMGEAEGPQMLADFRMVQRALQQASLSDEQVQVSMVKGAEHNEAAWRQPFAEGVRWLFKFKPTVNR